MTATIEFGAHNGTDRLWLIWIDDELHTFEIERDSAGVLITHVDGGEYDLDAAINTFGYDTTQGIVQLITEQLARRRRWWKP